MKHLRTATAAAVLSLTLAVSVASVSFATGGGGGQEKVGICHRTAAESNPYVYLEIPADQADGHLTGTDKQHNHSVTWATDGSWRGVPHQVGDERLDYLATSSSDCEDTTTPPTEEPTEDPTEDPTEEPTEDPSETPTETPTPSETPSETPTETPSKTSTPTETPSVVVTEVPSSSPPAAAETTSPTPEVPTEISTSIPTTETPEEEADRPKPKRTTSTRCLGNTWVTVVRVDGVKRSTSYGAQCELRDSSGDVIVVQEEGL